MRIRTFSFALTCIAFGWIFFIQNFSFSQSVVQDTTVTDSVAPSYRKLRLAFNYSSATTLLGKKDSVSIPILSPSIKYTTSKDFFYQASLVHTNTTSKLFDELDLRVGYNYYFSDRWDASISYTRFFFSKEVDRLNAIVNNDINVYVGFDWNYVYSAVSFDFTSGKRSFNYQSQDTIYGKNGKKYVVVLTDNNSTISSKDYTLTFMNSRQFYFFDVLREKDKMIITPELDIYFGTQNAVQNDNTTKKLARAKKQVSQSSTTNTSIPFLAYNINLDFRYILKQWTFNLSPFYTIPQKVTNKVQTSSPFFVMYGGIFYTWKWLKNK